LLQQALIVGVLIAGAAAEATRSAAAAVSTTVGPAHGGVRKMPL
jgi:hypothetical protein